jgi:hypothetical protein
MLSNKITPVLTLLEEAIGYVRSTIEKNTL